MSFNLKDTFKMILRLQEQSATLERRDSIAAINVRVAPANYFRDFDAVENIPVTGNEFVLAKDHLDGTGFETTGVRRGDIIRTSIYGILTVEEVRPMTVFGNMVGYRIRTGK